MEAWAVSSCSCSVLLAPCSCYSAPLQKYAISLTNQLGKRGVHTAQKLGAALPMEELDKFTDEQIEQVVALL